MNFSERGVFVMINLFALPLTIFIIWGIMETFFCSPLDYIYNLGYNGINRVEKLLDISEFGGENMTAHMRLR